MTREELRDYVDEQRTLNNIPYHVYSALIDCIDTLEQEPIIEKDGTLIVTTDHYENVGRVLVQYGTNGTLFYQDREPTTKNDLGVLDKIRAEIDHQQKWLLHAGYTAYNVDIALDAIKSVVAESEGV